MELVPQHKYLVTVEENVIAGGYGSGVLEFLSQKRIPTNNSLLLGLPDEFVTHGEQNLLREKVGLTSETMAKKIMEHFSLKERKATTKPKISFCEDKDHKVSKKRIVYA